MSFNEGQHPRHPAGSSKGGEFASKAGSGFNYPSPKESGVYDSLDDAGVRALTKERLHKELSRDELASIAGAQPGSRVVIAPDDGIDGLTVMVTIMGDDGFPIGDMTRGFSYRTVRNEEIELKKGFRGKGIGLKIFSQQVEQATKHGFHSIEAHAVGYPGDAAKEYGRNGYNTWAQFGFDGVIDHGYGPNGEKTVHEVMMAPGGRAWWRANGSAFMGTFSLSEGSTSRRVFDEYKRLKGL